MRIRVLKSSESNPGILNVGNCHLQSVSETLPPFSCSFVNGLRFRFVHGKNFVKSEIPTSNRDLAVKNRHRPDTTVKTEKNLLVFRKTKVPGVNMAKIGILKIGILKIGILKIGILKIGKPKIGILKIGILKIGILKIGILKIGILKIGILKIGIIFFADLFQSFFFRSQLDVSEDVEDFHFAFFLLGLFLFPFNNIRHFVGRVKLEKSSVCERQE